MIQPSTNWKRPEVTIKSSLWDDIGELQFCINKIKITATT